jgi:5-(carboxyamino)imidazole ribonucleotide synthase
VTLVPAAISDSLADKALDAATRIANGLDYCGVLAVEFFISTDGRVLVNEMAPRPHNSGHYTNDACVTSQFEQQLRMVCGLAPGSCRLHSPVAMLNLLGDIWPPAGIPDWEEVLQLESAKLHLYGKKEARPGRKMGHINCLGASREETLTLLEKVRRILA